MFFFSGLYYLLAGGELCNAVSEILIVRKCAIVRNFKE